ncbi:MAG: MBL fold metallo-hydrolase [Spirochaetes bacterium]|nr:MBL fold metallo-hydrolase [Spirochaetota bacterium]MBN2771050.1 MBL fold metallo-hydrolase [Spirochaetota bacterium]
MFKKIKWLKTDHEAGSASLRVVVEGAIIYFDPAFLTSFPERGDADVICISHWHDDHCDYKSFVKLMNEKTVFITNPAVESHIVKYVDECRVHSLKPGGELSLGKFSINAVASYEEESGVHNKEFGFTGFVVKSDEGTLYYSGDAE